MTHLQTALHEIGMSSKESTVYIALLQAGKAQIGTLARRCGINRSTVHDVVQTMVLRGYIYTSILGSKNRYFPIDPSHLHSSLHSKAQRFLDVLPDFTALMNDTPSVPQTTYIESLDGIIKLYDTQIRETKDGMIRSFVGHAAMDPALHEYYTQIYTPARINAGIHNRVIATSTSGDQRFWGTNEKNLTQTRLLDHPLVDFATQIDLFGDHKVASIHYESHHLTAVVVQSEALYKTMESLFEWIWHKA